MRATFCPESLRVGRREETRRSVSVDSLLLHILVERRIYSMALAMELSGYSTHTHSYSNIVFLASKIPLGTVSQDKYPSFVGSGYELHCFRGIPPSEEATYFLE